jgi:YihY family inner membrane protein
VTSPPEKVVRWFDDRQQDRPWLSLPIGVVRKYADDRASAFAGLLTFQVFLGMLPLLVVSLTLAARYLEGVDDVQDEALTTAMGQFPVIGPRIEEDISTLDAGGLALLVSIGGLLWTSSGIYHSLQLALNQVWNVEGIHRQGWVSRHLRAVVLFTLVVAATVGAAVIRGWRPLGGHWIMALGRPLLGALLAAVLLLGVFRLATSPDVPLRHLVPAAAAAGVAWEVLQRIGAYLVSDRLAEAGELYGTIGIVVVALFWINLLARAALLSNELAVVTVRGLWPRRIAQPPLTEADQEVLAALVRNERRRPEQQVDVSFEDPDSEPESDDRGDGDTDNNDSNNDFDGDGPSG